jgi:hypothetical protein
MRFIHLFLFCTSFCDCLETSFSGLIVLKLLKEASLYPNYQLIIFLERVMGFRVILQRLMTHSDLQVLHRYLAQNDDDHHLSDDKRAPVH